MATPGHIHPGRPRRRVANVWPPWNQEKSRRPCLGFHPSHSHGPVLSEHRQLEHKHRRSLK